MKAVAITTEDSLRKAIRDGAPVEFTAWDRDSYELPPWDSVGSGGWVPVENPGIYLIRPGRVVGEVKLRAFYPEDTNMQNRHNLEMHDVHAFYDRVIALLLAIACIAVLLFTGAGEVLIDQIAGYVATWGMS